MHMVDNKAFWRFGLGGGGEDSLSSLRGVDIFSSSPSSGL